MSSPSLRILSSALAPSVSFLQKGSVPWILAAYKNLLFPSWLFKGGKGEKKTGRPPWPYPILMALLILRWTEEGMSRSASIERAKFDRLWRAAMGLPPDGPTPCARVVQDCEAFMQQILPGSQLPRILLFHEHIVRLSLEAGVVGNNPIWSMDSTPVWAYGAVLDTVRLLGDGLSRLTRLWARAQNVSLESIAIDFDIPHVLAKSTKGAFRVDWSDSNACNRVIHQLATKVIDFTQHVRKNIESVPNSKRKTLLRQCRNLLRVISDNLETNDQGLLVIAQRVAKDRLISLTDPQARHGRKSQGRTFNGFKAHGFGDVVSGLILSLTVTKGNAHDGSVGQRLIKRAVALRDDIDLVLADSAYSGARLRFEVHGTTAVQIIAPPPRFQKSSAGRYGKESFVIDFEAGTALCPNDIPSSSRQWLWSSQHAAFTWRYNWSSEDCASCPQRPLCNTKKRAGHNITLHPYEQELRQAREQWTKPAVRRAYRRRNECERLMHIMTRRGKRQARSWGLAMANQQAYLIAATHNLKLLAEALALMEAQQMKRAV